MINYLDFLVLMLLTHDIHSMKKTVGNLIYFLNQSYNYGQKIKTNQMILLKLWNIQIFLCKKRCNIWLIWIIYEYDTVCINHEHDTFCINHEFFIIQHAYFIVSLQTLNICFCIFNKRILNQQSNALNLNEMHLLPTWINLHVKFKNSLRHFKSPLQYF